MPVNNKTRLRVSAELRPQIAEALRHARNSLGFTQTELAQALGCSQGAITRWERAIDSPPISAISLLAKMVPADQTAFWLGAGAMTGDHEIGGRQVPVLRDAAAAGTPRAIDEGEIEYTLTFPPSLLPRGGKLFGVKIEGDSMSPFLETGYVVLIDVASRSPERLAGRMVAAREGDGLTIKWLRKQGDGVYLLVPQNTSLRHQIHIMHADGDWSIVGEVVKWIGEPPPPPKRK